MNILRFEPRQVSFRRKVLHAFQAPARINSYRNADRFTPQSAVNEMQEIVHLAGDGDGLVVKGHINRAAKRLGMDIRECERLWYGQRKVIPSHLADRLRAVLPQLQAEQARRLEGQLARLRGNPGSDKLADAG